MDNIITNERILVYGGTGSGKSDSWLSIAEALNDTDSVFYCLDTDKSIRRLLATDYSHLTNVKVVECRSWDTFEATLKRLNELGLKDKRQQDWIVIDFVDQLWQFIQNWFTQKYFGKDYDDYIAQVREATKSRDAKKLEILKGWTDWQVINANYQDAVNELALEFDCNHYWTAKSKEYYKADAEKEESKEMATQFTNLGFAPDGEKRNAYRMHTVLFFNCDGESYNITTIKDRGRKKLKNFKFSTDENRHKFIEVYSKIINREGVMAIS
jgi:energy-coupling factor transporter ATP-binding protein EcfA2